ncbi:tRNA-splicing endonuclease, subunit Sen54 [Penicillium occitanis (nom. inval.)]|nr:hypothetical protein PENOC_020490 [Penicillium occitanis (nom. inval.)]PCH09569.1 tRNA-splicing endonuclease, subunit Sen54 [Penicillium occitanis (nom. inval.)]
MADLDEDVIHHPPSGDSAPQAEIDLSDEMQDFRFLNSLSLVDSSQATLPRRGEKDFEPNPTMLQSDILAASRHAMYTAISHPRLHAEKSRCIGIYAPEGPTPLPTEANNQEDVQANGEGKPATKRIIKDPMAGISPDACVCVPQPRGPFFKTMGRADRWNRVWLLPEEAIYLVERGSLYLKWPATITEPVQVDDEDMDVPMSLEAAYACMMGHAGLTLDRYVVYSGLKRNGYTVVRAPSWYGTVEEPEHEIDDEIAATGSYIKGISACWNRFYESIASMVEKDYSAQGPLIGVSTPRNYNALYRKLALIPAHNAAVPKPERKPTEAPFQFTYYIYKPSTPYKISAPQAPDFRLAVVDARSHTSIPTMRQLSALIESSPYEPPRGEKMERNVYTRLRQGYRSAILAIVDQGIVSYLRFADAGFSREKIFENQGPPRGGKTGGYRGKKNGGKGRGR